MAGIKRKEAPKAVAAQGPMLKKKQKLAAPGNSKKKAPAKEEFPESDTTEDDDDELDGGNFQEDASMSDADDDLEGVALQGKKSVHGDQDGADGDKKTKRAHSLWTGCTVRNQLTINRTRPANVGRSSRRATCSSQGAQSRQT